MLCEMLVLSSEKEYRIQKVQGRMLKFIVGTKWILYEEQVGHAQILLFCPHMHRVGGNQIFAVYSSARIETLKQQY